MTYDDRDTVCQKGKFRLEEWEDVNYCEHCFYNGDEPLEDEEVVILLSDLTTENEQLKKQIKVYEYFLDENDLDIEWSCLCTANKCHISEDIDFDCKDCKYMELKE